MTRQRTVLSEASGTARATESKGIWRVKLIAGDVAGSSGYYPASVLERDGSRAFPSGTHVYLDHPTLSEGAERPERSVRDLVGALIEDASYEDDPTDGKGLYAKVMFKESVREDVEFYARTAGMSIRAIGVHDESQDGELIVTELLEGISVDIVTHAGAGGKLVTMTESARKGQEPESMLFAQLSESDRNGMERLFAEIQELRSTISEMREATKAPEAPELSFGEIVAKLDAAELPNASRERIANAYAPGVDVDKLIADEAELVAQIRDTLKAEQAEPQAPAPVETAEAPVQESAVQAAGAVKVSESSDTELKNALTKMGWI